uniref:Snurportin-1 n=1 Tax=Glossina pallidipes TaxID=7398 RepID=A0A1B0AG22_GLOPL
MEFYKKNFKKEDRQEIRRLQLLNEQKCRRLEQHDEGRNFQIYLHKVKQHKHPKFQDIYGSEIKLQLSEWMREKPSDLSDWFLVPCPRGQRCFVAASDGKTKMYSKFGRFCLQFHSQLPGDGTDARKSSTILDCVFCKELDLFYVLDVIFYGHQSMLNCDAQFRFFWLRSKFEENESNFEKRTENNNKSFCLLKRYDMAHEERIAAILQTYPIWSDNQPQLDGFLFYHKEASYTCGTTPLVCWLFAFMVPDILEIFVSCEYVRPNNYSNPLIYMDEFDKEMAQKRGYNPYTKNLEKTNCHMEMEDEQEQNVIEGDDNALREIMQTIQ